MRSAWCAPLVTKAEFRYCTSTVDPGSPSSRLEKRDQIMMKLAAFLAIAAIVASPAFASSDDAWAEFALEVETACFDATAQIFIRSHAAVDPFGSESFGLALVSGETDAGEWKNIICVYDKQTGKVEIGTEFDLI
jgi:hypothetical protein